MRFVPVGQVGRLFRLLSARIPVMMTNHAVWRVRLLLLPCQFVPHSVLRSVSGASYTHRSDSKSTRNTTSSASASEDVDVDIGVGDEHINPHRGGLRRLRHRREHEVDVEGMEEGDVEEGGSLVVFGRYRGYCGRSSSTRLKGCWEEGCPV